MTGGTEEAAAALAGAEAERHAAHPARATALAERVLRKARRRGPGGPLREVWDDLTTMARLTRAWASGGYAAIPKRTLALVLTALVYFLVPTDLVPDFLPWTGLLDDATLIAWVVSSASDDIERFRAWERDAPPPPEPEEPPCPPSQ